jgi:hypothetical protein
MQVSELNHHHSYSAMMQQQQELGRHCRTQMHQVSELLLASALQQLVSIHSTTQSWQSTNKI